MSKNFLLSLLLLIPMTRTASAAAPADSINKALVDLYSQLLVYPQEKIYVQADRPYYLNGEKLFFRTFLLQASTLKRADWSRYIYTELVSPTDSVLLRQQVRVQDDRMFYGHMQLPETLPEGNYRLRAYTRYMENTGEKFFFSKAVYIADPNASKTKIDIQASNLNNKEIALGLKFSDSQTKSPLKPQSLTVYTSQNRRNLSPEKDSWADYSTKLNSGTRIVLVDYKDGSHSFKKYLSIPQPETSPELSFFPEGGQLVAGQNCRVAFKALLPDGKLADVEGEVIGSRGNKVVEFSTAHDGMGTFNFVPRAGENYLAKINWQGEEKNFALPLANGAGVALLASWQSDSLRVKVLAESQKIDKQAYYLFIHRQGVPIYFKPWNFSQKEVVLQRKDLSTGVTHLMLLDRDFMPVSERLVFNNLRDRIIPQISLSKPTFKPREKVDLAISVPKSESDTILPTFAISVTDDKDVRIDTTTNIVSEILLSSELEGTIPNPAWYFGDDPKAGEYADLLVLTHGWRRYNVEGPLQGNVLKPTIRPETSQSFSGKLRGFLNKSLAGGNVKMTAVGYNSPQLAQSDANGNFRFDGFEFPDSTAYFFVAATRKGSESVSLSVDTILYPKVSVPFLVPQLKKESSTGVSEETMENYIAKASKKYTSEYGIRQVDLPEVMVKGAKREKPKRRVRIDNHTYGLEPSRFISPDNIEEYPPASFEELLSRIPGLNVNRTTVETRGQTVNIAIDGVILTKTIDDLQSYISLDDIAQVDLYLEPAQTLAFPSAKNFPSGVPVIAFTTWPPGLAVKRKLSQFTNRKRILPLGYQVPVEFYSPKYDIPEALNSPTPDLRSTIYWKPNVATDTCGKTSVSFYASDSQTTYSAVMEGIGGGRKLIYLYKKNLLKVGTR